MTKSLNSTDEVLVFTRVCVRVRFNDGGRKKSIPFHLCFSVQHLCMKFLLDDFLLNGSENANKPQHSSPTAMLVQFQAIGLDNLSRAKLNPTKGKPQPKDQVEGQDSYQCV